MLTITDTIPSLATTARAEAAARRAAKIAGSKTNYEYLQHAGVIITCDDAMDNAFRYDREREEATRRGLSLDVIQEEGKQRAAEDTVRASLKLAVQMNETPEERQNRMGAAQAAAVGFKPNGRPCNHATTKKDRGWINAVGGYNMHSRDQDGNMPFVCCRCGATCKISPLTAPTEQAKIAAAILAREGK